MVIHFSIATFAHTALSTLMVLLWLLLLSSLLTVIERKGLAAIHRRKGPSYLGYFGLLQIAADGVKLIYKSVSLWSSSRASSSAASSTSSATWLSPFWLFVGSYAAGAVYLHDILLGPSTSCFLVLLLMVISTIGHLGIVVPGYASFTKYTVLGSIRACIMYVSYDVLLLVLLLMLQVESLGVLGSGSGTLSSVMLSQSHGLMSMNMLRMPLLAITLYFVTILEVGRVPCDMAESESELVSGYNIEYSGIQYAFMASAEYASMVLGCLLLSTLLIGASTWTSLISTMLLFFFGMIVVRATLPRMRFMDVLRLMWHDLSALGVVLFGIVLLI